MEVAKKMIDLYFHATLATTKVISKGQTIFIRLSTGSISDILPAYTKYQYKPGTISIDTRMSKHIYGCLFMYDRYRENGGNGFRKHRIIVSVLLRTWAGSAAKKATDAILSFRTDTDDIPIGHCKISTEQVTVNHEKYTRAILELDGYDGTIWVSNFINALSLNAESGLVDTKDISDIVTVNTNVVISLFNNVTV